VSRGCRRTCLTWRAARGPLCTRRSRHGGVFWGGAARGDHPSETCRNASKQQDAVAWWLERGSAAPHPALPAADKRTHFLAAAPLHSLQEAELQAAVDKATEAEARASEAEARMKEARVRGGAGGLGATCLRGAREGVI
jgi:hypothetical protein